MYSYTSEIGSINLDPNSDGIISSISDAKLKNKGSKLIKLKLGENIFPDSTKNLNVIDYLGGLRERQMVDPNSISILGIMYKDPNNPDNDKVSSFVTPEKDSIKTRITKSSKTRPIISSINAHKDFKIMINCNGGHIEFELYSNKVRGLLINAALMNYDAIRKGLI